MIPITGLEKWAEPLIYAMAAASTLAAWLTATRFKASASAGIPTAQRFVALLIAATGLVAIGCAWFGATIMAPLKNHVPLAAGLWAAGCLSASLFCAKNNK